MESITRSFWKNRKVLITGHTGFKGAWLCKILKYLEADVVGYALAPEKNSLYEMLYMDKEIHSYEGDIRNFEKLKEVFEDTQPEIVLHLAAQPLVRLSYEKPLYTFETNIMGTVNICECVRNSKTVKSFVNITTDKVYKNQEWEWGYRENEMLDGYDPYSNSKSCSELVTHSYINAFFSEQGKAVSTARAGNVIGGGDFAKDRIVPDCIRALKEGKTIQVRNPYSVRPYQHVLEPLFAYLLLAEKQYNDVKYAGYYNIGPDEVDCITTGVLVDKLCKYWGKEAKWEHQSIEGPHEANFLKLDCSKIKSALGWHARWNVDDAIEKTVEWAKVYMAQGDIAACMLQQIEIFLRNDEEKSKYV